MALSLSPNRAAEPLADRERHGRVLLAIAREAIDEVFEPGAHCSWIDSWLRSHGATFVTLRMEGELRGCIGTIDPRRPLGDDVAGNAHAAAYRDPRFRPVSAAERERLAIEVSLLSPRSHLPAASESEALTSLRPGIDGLVVEYGDARATFLPQVWENIPDPLDFLLELRRKAGLPSRFWHPELRLYRYTVDKFR